MNSIAAPAQSSQETLVRTSADVQQTVRAAVARGVSLRIVGGGTWLEAGRPVRPSEVLNLRQLTGILQYVPGDLTITALAGTSLADIDRATAEHDQWLALDPFGAREGTLGATIATASVGPLATCFGTPRDVVLGVECVTGDGDVVQGGARVVKHVAGFDLVRLATGAWGTLGILTTVTLRLRARAPMDATYAVALDGSLREWMEVYRRLSIAPLAAELLDAQTARALGVADVTLALVRVSGNEEAVSAQEHALRELGDVRSVQNDVWSSFASGDPSGPSAALRLSLRSSRMSEVWDEALRLSRGVPRARVHATLDRGVARVVFPDIAEHELEARLSEPGTAPCTRVFEALPAALWSRVAPSHVNDALSQRVRNAFDPDRRLNPGILGET
ncbi:MAG TPA: FAD-binding protein [Gemmatimonadaceae bacterium]|nr:FAD-binding protein [Gemmatimonadaceae bacterium]